MKEDMFIYELPGVIGNKENACFVCCVSFEERSVSIPKVFKNIDLSKKVAFIFSPFVNETDQNLSELCAGDKSDFDVRNVEGDSPVDIFKEYCVFFEELVNSNKIYDLYVDVTTFTRESLLIFLRTLHKFKNVVKTVKFFYAFASEMGEWLSRGVSEYRSVLGFAGNYYPNKPIHLIILTGFEIERAISTIEEYEPQHISIGVGSEDESISGDFYNRNKVFVEELMKIYGSSIYSFSFSLKNPVSCSESLNHVIALYKESNPIVLPLSNKLSTIGAGITALSNKDVQLCYPKASQYNFESYSVPGDRCLVVEYCI